MDRFFLDGVIEIANEAINIVGKITILREKDMAKIQTLGKRASGSAIKVMPKPLSIDLLRKVSLFPKIKIGNTDNPMSIRNISKYLSVTIDA
jgi:hypothetical protein